MIPAAARWALVVALCACSSPVPAAAPAAGGQARIDVFPGPGALAKAVSQAHAGDILRIHRGRYREAIDIDKPLTLKAVGPGPVTVDGRCRTGVTIDVISGGVTLRGFRVVGATEGYGELPSEVDFAGVSGGRAKDMVFRDTCDAQYGINIFDTGSMVVTGSLARGFSDAGIYVGAIAEGPVSATKNETRGSNVGVIVEDSAPGTVSVIGNDVHDNTAPGEGEPTGILLRGSDGELVQGNTVRDNGTYGIYLDGNSDGNRIFDNAVSGSGTLDALDKGSGNCWNGTTAATRQPDPLPVC